MNFSLIVSILEEAYTHRGEIADACEAGIHAIRRLEHLTNKHNTTVDKILVTADEGFKAVKKSAEETT